MFGLARVVQQIKFNRIMSTLLTTDEYSALVSSVTTDSITWNPITTTGTGTSGGYIYTSPNTSPNTMQVPWISTGTSPTMTVQKGGTIDIQGDDADIKMNGKSMKAWMEKVEERLNILTPNPELEKDWDDLRRLGERYRKLEKKCKEKAQMWEELKKVQPKQP